MKLAIVGSGVFGTFLKEELAKVGCEVEDVNCLTVLLGGELSVEADTVILAVPFSGLKPAAKAFKGKRLVNVCSVQEESNEICSEFGRTVGVHPMFGPRSPKEGRTCVCSR